MTNARFLISRNKREGWYCGYTKIVDCYGFVIISKSRNRRRGRSNRLPLRFYYNNDF